MLYVLVVNERKCFVSVKQVVRSDGCINILCLFIYSPIPQLYELILVKFGMMFTNKAHVNTAMRPDPTCS